MTKNQKRAIEIARAACQFNGKRTFHLSLIFRKNKLLCFAENVAKTHTRNLYNCSFSVDKKGRCSELSAFLLAKSKFRELDWNKITIVNIRLGRDLEILNSRPCSSCESLYAFINPRKLVYSTPEGFKTYKPHEDLTCLQHYQDKKFEPN